jgi:hypothetical protein
VLPDRFNPAGSVPLETDHVYGGVPPVALSPCEYATPTVPAGNDDVVMASCAAPTMSDRGFESIAVLLSVTCAVIFACPVTDGVPLITPVLAVS